MAEATVAYHAGGFGKKDQFIRWKDPYNVDAGARYFFSNIQWIGDGQTFEVHPFYADQYPMPHASGGPRWSDAGKPAGHSTTPILVKPVSGPLVAAGNMHSGRQTVPHPLRRPVAGHRGRAAHLHGLQRG